jgi:hypothetical protein
MTDLILSIIDWVDMLTIICVLGLVLAIVVIHIWCALQEEDIAIVLERGVKQANERVRTYLKQHKGG